MAAVQLLAKLKFTRNLPHKKCFVWVLFSFLSLQHMSKNISYLQLTPAEEEEYGHDILYAASFKRNVETYTWYATFGWVFVCIPCILIYGIGIIGLLWTPFIWYIARAGIESRKLFVTSDSIIYIAEPPACIPCLGRNKQEKHVLLSLITDVVVQEGWYQSCWNLDSVKIENAGQGQAGTSYDLAFIGMENSKLFKKVVLRAAAAKRAGQSLSREDISAIISGDSQALSDLASRPAEQSHAQQATSQETDTKLDRLNETMMRIEQLLARQVPAYGPISSEQEQPNLL